MDIWVQAVSRIIKEQQSVIGPLAISQANKVSGLSAATAEEVKINGNGKEVLEHLVNQYEKVFGKTSVEVCREAIDPIRSQLTQTELPDILKN